MAGFLSTSPVLIPASLDHLLILECPPVFPLRILMLSESETAKLLKAQSSLTPNTPCNSFGCPVLPCWAKHLSLCLVLLSALVAKTLGPAASASLEICKNPNFSNPILKTVLVYSMQQPVLLYVFVVILTHTEVLETNSRYS